jgi:signal transduction histidine kinase
MLFVTAGNLFADFTISDVSTTTKLKGQWSYVGDRFLSSGEISRLESENVQDFRVPGRAPAKVGTAFTKINVTADNVASLGLRMRSDSAFEVFWGKVGGEVTSVYSSGVPALTADASIPLASDPLISLRLEGKGEYLLLIHLSGHYYNANIWLVPEIKDYEIANREYTKKFIATLFIFAMVFVMSIYYLLLFFFRPEDRIALYLALLAMPVLMRLISVSAEVTALPIFAKGADIYEILRKLEFASPAFSSTFILLFAAESLGINKIKKLAVWNIPVSLVWPLFVLSTTAEVYKTFTIFLNSYLLLSVIVAFVVSIYGMYQRKTGSGMMFIGFSFLGATLINDALIGVKVIQDGFFMVPAGFLAVIFTQGQVISKLFAKAFRTAEDLTRNLEKKVKEQTHEIRTMLDNIPQGVFSVTEGCVIDIDYSLNLSLILEKEEIAGNNLGSLLLDESDLTNDRKDQITQSLIALLGEVALNFELNKCLLPNELNYRDKSLELTWSPLVDEKELVHKVLVTVKDATQLKQLEKEKIKQQKLMVFIQEIVAISIEAFNRFMASSEDLLQSSRNIISMNNEKNIEIIKILFVNMHTVKGAARTLGFHQFVSPLHDYEQKFANLMKGTDTIWNREELLAELKAITDLLAEYKKINAEVLGRGIFDASKVMIDRDVIEQQVSLLGELIKTNQDAEQKLSSTYKKLEEVVFESAEDLFLDILKGAYKVAKDLNKPEPIIKVEGDKVRVNFELQTLFRNVFTHIIRNSLDHGIETESERLKKNKQINGLLRLEIKDQGQNLVVTYKDDGRGLDLGRLLDKGKEQGLIAADCKDAASIATLIFASGLSTAEGVTQFSGRGVGMDAIKKYIEQAGGSVNLELGEANDGFVSFALKFTIPHRYYISHDEQKQGFDAAV